MSAVANTPPSQSDFLYNILERLNGTVSHVSQLRQSLGNLETELIEIRNQCQNARAAVATASTNKTHNGNKNTTVQNFAPAPGGHPRPVPLQSPDIDRHQIQPSREQKGIDRHTKTPKSEPKHDPMSNPIGKSARLSMKTKAGHSPSSASSVSSSSRISRGSGSTSSRVVKANNSLDASRSQFRTTLAQPPRAQGAVAQVPAHKHAQKRPTTPSQIPLRPLPRPPTQPSPFPDEDINLSYYPPELKDEGDNWFVLYNPSPKVKRVLDVKLVHTLMHDSVATCAKFSWDGKWLATGCRMMAQIYDVDTGIKTCTLNDANSNSGYVNDVCFSPDGKHLATGSDDKQVRIWDIANQQIHDLLEGHKDEVWSLNYSPNGQFIVSGSADGTVRIWDIQHRTSKVLIIDGHYLPPEHGVWSVAISPDGRYVAVGTLDTVVSIWEITTGVQVQMLRGHTNGVSSVVFTPDGMGLISGCLDVTLKYWDVSQMGMASTALTRSSESKASSSPCLMNLTGHNDVLYTTAISQDGTWVISGSFDGKVLFWDTRTGVAQCMLSGHKSLVWQVDLSPVGNVLVTASDDRQVRIWSYGTFQ